MYCNVVWLRRVLRATTAYTFSTSEPPKMVRTPSVLDILTWKCASRHNGVHFFDISTSKSGPRPPVFSTFDFKMCFAPQLLALFQHLDFQKWSEPLVFCTFWLRNVLPATTACTFSTSQLPKVVRDRQFLTLLTWKCASRHNGVHFFDLNFQKWSGPGVFCTFWLQNVLRATTACTFSTSQLPKVVRPWCVLYILTWKCASRHNGAHFFDISTSKSGPDMVCCTFWLGNVLRATTACNFSSLLWPAGSAPAALASLLFDPPEPQIIGKTQCFATFLPFRASVSSVLLLFLFYSSLF